MFTSSELEGEVDHSFFDSDGDSGRNVEEKREKDLKMKKQISSTLQRESVKHSGHLAVDLHSRTEKTKRHSKEVENKSGNKTDASSISFIPDEPIHEDKDELNLHSKSTSGAFLTIPADIPNDGDNQRWNGMRKSALAFPANSKETNEQLYRKLIKNQHPKNSPPTSDEDSTYADSESSFSSQKGILNSSNLSKPKSFVRRKTRGTRHGSVEHHNLPNMSTDESDDSVTDVSPLSSPDSGSLQSLSSEVETEGHEVHREPKTLPSSNIHQAVDSNPDVDESLSGLERHLEQKMVLQISGGVVRKNFSFSNDEVRRIDRENKRLLQALTSISSGARAEKLSKKSSCPPKGSSVSFYPHSAESRERQQFRIHQENLVFLKRLQSTQATPGLRRVEQLADHQRLTSMPIYRPYSGGSSRIACEFIRPRQGSSSAGLINTYTRRTTVPGIAPRKSSTPSWH
ncbi:cilia- and flagella-associated protein 97 [Poeciliopsis prolifica]|uniref:cilia- and flagella-associated protein 97 n=1 Tax=Poeciliopsis prolifica TaxID=188132 RepID=UPI0024138D06|nr:cilia- and flagella-associated protein 97 [Poeciliopsis prolifica]